MTIFTFANNINTTLAGAVSPSATTITLASTANLPASIPAGEVLVITLNDVATRQNFEIVYATARTGATLTVLRAQEGTAALAWLTGDFAYSPPTAGQMQSLASGHLLNVQIFSTPGTFTYTPTPGMASVIAYVQAAGGGTGGVAAASSTQISIAGGASSGALAIGRYSASTIGASQTITVGAGGTPGAAGNSNGSNGGSSSLGAIATAQGGLATGGFGPNGSTVFGVPGAGTITPPTASGGNILNISGEPGAMSIGGSSFGPSGLANSIGGPGGGSPICGGGVGPGAGASGVAIVGASATAGNGGQNGIVILYEYS